MSHLHAQTANGTWSTLLDKPILGITNGVHPPSWVGGPARSLYESLGADLDNLDEAAPFWKDVAKLNDAQLWEAHRRQKLELAYFCRRRLQSQFARHGEAPMVLEELSEALDPDVLTIGFARRFATYKRAALIFSNRDALRTLVREAGPIQLVFAGKAHPQDAAGQALAV